MRSASRRSYGVKGAPYLFLVPATVLFLLFFALPIGYAVWLSFRKVQVSGLGLGSGARKEVWAGLENYTGALSDSELLDGALRVLGYGCSRGKPVELGSKLSSRWPPTTGTAPVTWCGTCCHWGGGGSAW
ncbi:hypothetical protein SGRIM128S_01547 [Streptomyces griseomycini]